MTVIRVPDEPDAGLNLPFGVIIILELCPQGQVEPVGDPDFVLNESAGKLKTLIIRHEDDFIGILEPIEDQPVIEPPDQFMAVEKREPVLKINIKGAHLNTGIVNVRVVVIIIELQNAVGLFRKGAGPSAQQMPAFGPGGVLGLLNIRVPLR